MDNQDKFKTPNKALVRMQVVRLGKILFTLQVIASIALASPFTFAIYPLYYAALILLTLFTGFTLFIAYPGFASWWDPARIYNFTISILDTWKYMIPLILIISLLSILCLSFDKNKKHLGRMLASIIMMVLVIIYVLFRLHF